MNNDNIYESLFNTFKNKSYDSYVLECKKYKNLKDDGDFQNVIEGIPYPTVDNPNFNSIISKKKEFQSISDGIKSFDGCSQELSGLTSNQRFVKNFLNPGTPYNSLLLYHGVGVGKCHARDTPILMYDGSVKMVQDVIVNDVLMGDDSTPRNVLSLGKGEDYMFKITTSDNDSFTINSEHILCLKNKITLEVIEVTVSNYLQFSENERANLYLYSHLIEFSSDDDCKEDAYSIGFHCFMHNLLIPREYLTSKSKTRKRLLEGIIDASITGTILMFKSVPMKKDVLFLARSLGYGATIVSDEEIVIYKDDTLPNTIFYEFEITSVGHDIYYGFTLDSNNRYVMGNFIVTHNTCSAISVAEQYHEMYNKRVLVILSSNLVENFKKQIYDSASRYKCTGTKYPDMLIDKDIDEAKKAKKITKLINDRYEFMGYKVLANILDKNRTKFDKIEKFNKKVSDMFSDRLIIIDEAHNLRNPSETGKKKISHAFKTLITNVKNVKLLLLTATPMFNDATEIIWTLNLLLQNNSYPLLKKKNIFDPLGNLLIEKGEHIGKKNLIESTRGIVSFMRGENPYTFPFRLYPSINNDSKVITKFPTKTIGNVEISENDSIKFLEIVGSPMSKFQYDSYNSIVNSIENLDDINKMDYDDEDNTGINNIQISAQISNLVYPCKEKPGFMYGNRGFYKNFIIRKNKFEYIDPSNQFLAADNISKYSSKIHYIIENVKKSNGIVFIYSRYYGAGIFPLAIALEHAGYSKYSESICQGIKTEKNRGKYILISTNKMFSPNNNAEIAEAKKLNSDIKVIIVSKIGSEGIDFKRIREIHVLEPWYNLNNIEQIIGRGVRNCSHAAIPIAERNVTIYLHASTCPDPNIESIDLYTYRRAEQKQKRIADVETILKANSVDCILNKKDIKYSKDEMNTKVDIVTSQGVKIKNYEVGDRDNSYICGFRKCADSECINDINEDGSKIDESTFDPVFIKSDIKLFIDKIRVLYKDKPSYSLKKIHKLLNNKNGGSDAVISYTLNYIINNKVDFEFRGFDGYLIYRNKKYIWQPKNNMDERLTMAERKNYENHKILKRFKIEFKEEEKANNKSVSKVQEPNDFDINSLKALFNKKYEFVNSIIDIDRKFVVDSFVDSLDQDVYQELIKYLMMNKPLIDDFANECLSSLERAGVIFKGIYVFNHFDKSLYAKKNQEFKKCTILDIPQNINDELAVKLEIPLDKNTRGYMKVLRENIVFKIRHDPETSGFVCHNTSLLTLADLRESINALIPKKLNKRYLKLELCYIYELLKRSDPSQNFQRPYFIKI